MLKIFYSKYNSVIEDEIFNRSINFYKDGKEVYIFVPEQFTLDNEVKLMESIDEKAVSKIRVMSFERLSQEVLSEVGGFKKKHIDNVGRTMIIKKILNKHKNDFMLYRILSEKRGFVDLLLSQISEFKRCKLNFVDLDRVLSNFEGNDLLKQKLQEIYNIYREYENEIEGKYIDSDDRLGQLANIKNLSQLKNIAFFIHGFVDFSEIEKEILKNLLNSGVELNFGICLDFDKNFGNTFELSKSTFYNILDIAKEINVDVKTECVEYKNKKKNDLLHLENNLFLINPHKFKRFKSKFILKNVYNFDRYKIKRDIKILKNNYANNINLFSAKSISNEVEYIAQDIARNVVENGYRYKDIMVTASDLSRYSLLLKQSLKKYNIPNFIDEKRDITNNTIIRYIISILNILEGDYCVDNLMSFLKNDIRNIYKNTDDILDFENYILQKKLKGKMLLNDKYFCFDEKIDEEENFENKENEDDEVSKTFFEYEKKRNKNILKVRKYLIDMFDGKISERKLRASKAIDYSEIICSILESQNIYDSVQSFIDDLRNNNLLDEANENKQIWDIFKNILEQSVEVFGDDEISFSFYKEMLYSSIKSYKLGVIPPTQDQVVIGDISRSKSLDKKIVYICGADSNSLPNINNNDGIFTKSEKMELDAKGLNLRDSIDIKFSLEKVSTYILFGKANKKLNISYTLFDGAEESIFVRKLKYIFENFNYISQDFIYDISYAKPTLTKLSMKLNKYKEMNYIDDKWKDVFNYYKENEKYRDTIENIIKGLDYSNFKENINSNNIYSYPMKMNISRIKNFTDCPFKHFIKFGLKAKERKVDNIETSDMGILLHSTIEKFMDYLKDNSKILLNISDEYIENKIYDYFNESIDENFTKFDLDDKKNQFIVKRLKNTAIRAGKKSFEHFKSGEFYIYETEQEFDFYKKLPPIIINIDNKEIALTGKIDRIDIMRKDDKAYIKIIDYKTSNKEFSLSDAYNGVDIQLLVYLYATLNSKILNKENLKLHPAGAFYFPVTNPISKIDKIKEREKIDEIVEKAIKMDGIVANEDFIIRAFDSENDGNNKNNIINTSKKNLLSEEDIMKLLNHINKNLEKTIRNIVEGNIKVEPIIQKEKQYTGCDFCNYKNICLFEERLGDKYRIVKKYSKEEILENI